MQNTHNWCNTAPAMGEDGKAIGHVEFIKVDCRTNKLLPMDQQPAVYRWPGVSSNPSERLPEKCRNTRKGGNCMN